MYLSNGPGILYPMFGLAALTALVQALIPLVRVRAGIRGQIKTQDFALGESSSVPPKVSLPNRNYMNLLEFPVLLYVGCILAYVAVPVSASMLRLHGCSWPFVCYTASSTSRTTVFHTGPLHLVLAMSFLSCFGCKLASASCRARGPNPSLQQTSYGWLRQPSQVG